MSWTERVLLENIVNEQNMVKMSKKCLRLHPGFFFSQSILGKPMWDMTTVADRSFINTSHWESYPTTFSYPKSWAHHFLSHNPTVSSAATGIKSFLGNHLAHWAFRQHLWLQNIAAHSCRGHQQHVYCAATGITVQWKSGICPVLLRLSLHLKAFYPETSSNHRRSSWRGAPFVKHEGREVWNLGGGGLVSQGRLETNILVWDDVWNLRYLLSIL